jgi:RNA polymerase sigma-70 factor (ECF subfamily)
MNPEPLFDADSDENLLRRIAAGDAAAFTALFRRRQSDVYRFALHMTGLPPAAEDVTQDVFLALMRDAGRYDASRATVKAWLAGMARNHALRRLERDRRIIPLEDDHEETELAVQPDSLDALTRTERVEALRKAILTLPLPYREAVLLCDLQELTYAEAAAALDCAVGTVRSRLHRGRALLGTKMRVEVPAPGRASRCLA